MGKSAMKTAESSLGASAERFAALQEKLESESAPQRKQVGTYFSDIISGDRQKATRALAPQIEATRAQFGQAGKAIERNLPRGGVQQQARSDVAQAEAGAVGNLYTGGVNEALARLAALSTFGTQAGISAGGQGISAGSSLAELGAAQNAAAMGALGSFGGGMGGFMSSMAFKDNIQMLELEEFEALKDALLATPLFKYTWKDDPTGKQCSGVILERSDPIFAHPDGQSIDLQTLIGALLATVKQHQIEIEKLRESLRESHA
jgi:hypothetical protein